MEPTTPIMYRLSIEALGQEIDPDEAKLIIKRLRQIYPGACMIIDTKGNSNHKVRWPHEEGCMKEFSKEYPFYVFKMKANTDHLVVINSYQNGVFQTQALTIP